jgi:hypothetical protein
MQQRSERGNVRLFILKRNPIVSSIVGVGAVGRIGRMATVALVDVGVATAAAVGVAK